MFYVYLLESQKSKDWYVGYTSDLRKRLSQHQSKNGGQTTKRINDWRLVYYEAYLDKNDALRRERFLKSGSGHRFLKKQIFNHLNK